MLEWLPPASEHGVQYVMLSLDEAQSVRRAIHLNHPAICGGGDAAGVALVLPSSQRSLRRIDATVDAATTSVSESGDVCVQTARFFNNEMWFDDAQLIALLRGLSAVSMAERKQFFQSTIMSRRRDRGSWEDTSLIHAFAHADEHALVHVQGLFRCCGGHRRLCPAAVHSDRLIGWLVGWSVADVCERP